MDEDRARQLEAWFTTGDDTAPTATLCMTCVDILQVNGAGISIMSGFNSGPVCSSSDRVRQLEDLQFSLGEGPCHDAFTTSRIVSEPDLANLQGSNWPNYTPPALDLGVVAVFAFPLLLGVGTIGVLTLYTERVGMLTFEQGEDGRLLARILPAIMTAIQANGEQPLLTNELSDADAHRAEVHQATGMTAIQLGISVQEALIRIRAHAFATSQTVAHVSQQIVTRRLKLSDDGPRHPGASQ